MRSDVCFGKCYLGIIRVKYNFGNCLDGVQVSSLYCNPIQNGHFDAQQPAIIETRQIPNLSKTATKAS